MLFLSEKWNGNELLDLNARTFQKLTYDKVSTGTALVEVRALGDYISN